MITTISAKGLVLSAVVLLAVGKERRNQGERISHDFELSGQRYLETCSISRAMEDPTKVTSDPAKIAQSITTLARRCLEYIDDIKDDYVSIWTDINCTIL